MSSSNIGGPTGPKSNLNVTANVQESKPVQGPTFSQKLKKAGKSENASPVSQPDQSAQSPTPPPSASTPHVALHASQGANEDAIQAQLPVQPQTEAAPEASAPETSTAPEPQDIQSAKPAPEAVSPDTSESAVQLVQQPIQEVDAQAEDQTTVASPGSTSTLPAQSSTAPPVQQHAPPSSAALQAQRTGSQSRMSQVVTPTPVTTSPPAGKASKPAQTGQHRVVRTPHPVAFIEPIIKPENILFTGSNVPFILEGNTWYSQLENSKFLCVVHENNLRILGDLQVEKAEPGQESGRIVLELRAGLPPLVGTWQAEDRETFFFSIPNTFSESDLETLRKEQMQKHEELQLPSAEENLTSLPPVPDTSPVPMPGEDSPDISGDTGIQLDSDEFAPIEPPNGVMSPEEVRELSKQGPPTPIHEPAHSDLLGETQTDMSAPAQPARDPNRQAHHNLSVDDITAAATGLSAGSVASQATAALPNPDVPTAVGPKPAAAADNTRKVIAVQRGTGTRQPTDRQSIPPSDFASPEELPPAQAGTDAPNTSLPEFLQRPQSWGQPKFPLPPQLLDLPNGDTREKPKGNAMIKDDYDVIMHQISQLDARIEMQERTKSPAFNMVKFGIGLFVLGCVIAGSAILHLMYRTKPASKEQVYLVVAVSFMLAIMVGFLGMTIYFFKLVTSLESNFAQIRNWAVGSDSRMAEFISNAISISVPEALKAKMDELGWQPAAPLQEQTTDSFATPQVQPPEQAAAASHQPDEQAAAPVRFTTPPGEAQLNDSSPNGDSVNLREAPISGEHLPPSSATLAQAGAETLDEQAGDEDDGPTVATAPAHPTPAPVSSHTLDLQSVPQAPTDQTVGIGLPPEQEYQLPQQPGGFDPSQPMDLGYGSTGPEAKPLPNNHLQHSFSLPDEESTFVDSWLEKTKALFMKKGFVSFMIVWFLVCAAVTTLVIYNTPSDYLMALGGCAIFFVTPFFLKFAWIVKGVSFEFFFASICLGVILAGDSFYIYTYWNSFGEILIGSIPFIIIGTVIYSLISFHTRKFHHKPKETV